MRFKSIIGLIACWIFLICNILFDILDTVPPEVQTHGLPDLYYIPLFILIDIFIYNSYDTYKWLGKGHKYQWFFFMVLSSNQTIKNIFFKPEIQNYTDYITLIIILCYLIYHMLKRK